ncbi:nitrilase-related carbon-nitrogen hydrolase [Variovorax sp. dw_954]|uniref:nitrilase-related carbon-nitrogen hydrolase n=1 Tax=Variovorax sp. dw_954 TaxID=2720078 RepID=UPI001BD674EA|nr:nitrilase-related carbon-nitrogen hydrolase [Variovorax sp. dw_954]
MIPIYTAIGLQTRTFDCMYSLSDTPNFKRNLDHICNMIDVAVLSSIENPVKLLALAEGAIQGFPDELRDWDTAAYAARGAIDIPGPVTDVLAERAVKWGIYIIAQAKARMPEFPDRFFNTMFIIDPAGKIIHQHRKNIIFTIEHSTTPHDVYDQWVEMFGDDLDAFFPVARTPIGNIGACICMEGNLPETARGVAMNGAEIIYRPSSMENKTTQGAWEIQNRSRALDNACYVLAPNTGRHFIDDKQSQGFFCGGKSMIVDYRGSLMHLNDSHDDCFVSAPLNIEALRYHRSNAKNFNWIPHIRSELFRLIYEKSVWPANMTLKTKHMRREAAEEVMTQTVRKLEARGVFTRSALEPQEPAPTPAAKPSPSSKAPSKAKAHAKRSPKARAS